MRTRSFRSMLRTPGRMHRCVRRNLKTVAAQMGQAPKVPDFSNSMDVVSMLRDYYTCVLLPPKGGRASDYMNKKPLEI